MSTDGQKRIGIRLLDDLGGPRALVELAVEAENAGFDAVWIPHDTLRLNPLALIGAVADRTNRILIGIGNNPYATDPGEIATIIVTLDEFSGGRVLPNIGMHTAEMSGWIGVEASNPLQRTRESVEIVRLLLSGEVVEYSGSEYSWPKTGFLRMPTPKRKIPLIVSPFGKEFMALSGEIGDGSGPMITPPESAAEVVAAVHEGARRAGKPVEDVEIVGYAWISISERGDLARDRMADVVGYFGWFLDEFALNTIGLSRQDFAPIQAALNARDPLAARRLVTPEMLKLGISGTPDDCCAVAERILRDGVTFLSVGGPLGPDPRASIRLMGETLVPFVHGLS